MAVYCLVRMTIEKQLQNYPLISKGLQLKGPACTSRGPGDLRFRFLYFFFAAFFFAGWDCFSFIAARAAASFAIVTRNGEQLT